MAQAPISLITVIRPFRTLFVSDAFQGILLIAVAACIVAGLGWRRLTGWAAAGRADG